jgi:hypothetical protein
LTLDAIFITKFDTSFKEQFLKGAAPCKSILKVISKSCPHRKFN